jgi:[glutamine synthetase] adenylyltransferase / [glutamine synthetase]-adenylyl-L-tyrosine phosphorylase
MNAAFASISFAEPGRAEMNLALLERCLAGNLWATLPALLAQLPDPDGALNFLERYLRQESESEQASESVVSAVAYLRRHPAALHHLLLIFSYSRFLSETLIQQPDLITWLHRPVRHGQEPPQTLDHIKSPEDLHEEFARFEAISLDRPPAVVLARFKRREYLRITLRDVLGLATLAETALELSLLADVLLERALRVAEQKLQHAYGTPQYLDAAGNRNIARLAILSLGKLGGRELNYSSDIDLMFLYGRDGETSGGSAGVTTNTEYFVRLAQTMVKLITETHAEGSVFRVDLRLRPQGQEGDLTTSLPAALEYYRTRAREWELQMLIKARCSAGDAEIGRRFLHEIQPLIYRREFNLIAVEAVLNARQEITRDLERRAGASGHAAEWNIKLSPGGIRDIEFLTQCLQRLYGGADAWLRTSSTLVALQRLHDKGQLSGRDFFRLGSAYQFLRKVEHRLQLRDGLQRHTLPEAPDALERLARRSGVEPSAADRRTAAELLLHRLSQHFAEVREIYDRILALRPPAPLPPEEAAGADPGSGALLRRLGAEHPTLARRVAQAVSAVAASESAYARRGLLHFLGSAVLDPDVMAELELHPEWLDHAAEIFARSDLAVGMLSRHPEEIRVLADPGLAGFRGPLGDQDSATLDEAMAAVRVSYRRSVLATVVRALLATAQPFETFATLTRLTEEALRAALEAAAREVVGGGDLADGPLAVLALGRLGTGEMDIGSDVDVIFVTDERIGGESRESWRRLAERFVQVAGSHTREGLLFPVDTRLRPRGTEGEIAQALSYLREYFRSEAKGWEAATFLKARPVAGNLALGAEAVCQVHATLAERFSQPGELARQLSHTRELLEREATDHSRTLGIKGEFKKVPGGYYDLEYILAYLFLTRSLSPAESRGHALRQLAQLESTGALSATEAHALRNAALLYRSLDHALRLVIGRPANRLPEPALTPRVRRLLGSWKIPIGESIEAEVDQMRRQTRALYEQIVLAGARQA